MEWLNFFGLAAMICMLIPNAIYALKKKGGVNHCKNKAVNITEQVGRFTSMFLMIFNIGILEYGFRSDEEFALWLFGLIALMLLYWIFWLIYIFRRPVFVMLMLAIIPSVIFIGTGIMQRHILQIVFGIVFAAGHLFITYVNAKAENNSD